ncbi:MAG: phage recombination protein Bet [Desulfurobacterium sp.]|nr:MAG: phage recombination protein Bet [Desulfurobacterium sp.]
MEKTMTSASNIKILVADDGTQWTEEEVRDYLKYHVSAKNITEEDVNEFFRYCKAQRLNPYDIHLQKYGDGKPVLVVSKYAFLKRAEKSGKFAGYRAGVIVQRKEKLIYREGSVVLSGEKLVGGWAEAYRTDWRVPAKVEVSIEEYLRKDRNGKPFSMWKEKPATMIRKVALVQVLREAFPNEVGGLEVVSDSVNGDLGGRIEEAESDESEYTWDEEESQEQEEKEGQKKDAESEQKEEPKITEKQRKCLMAEAKKLWGKDYIEKFHQVIKTRYGKESSKELTFKEASRLIDEFKNASVHGS